jgi:hypothetical protein
MTFFVDAGGQIDASRVPATKPFLYGFIADDRGHLWVSVPGEVQQSNFDLFDPEGRHLGMVSSPVALLLSPARPVFKDGLVYGFTPDDLGVPYLVRLRIDTSGAVSP